MWITVGILAIIGLHPPVPVRHVDFAGVWFNPQQRTTRSIVQEGHQFMMIQTTEFGDETMVTTQSCSLSGTLRKVHHDGFQQWQVFLDCSDHKERWVLNEKRNELRVTILPRKHNRIDPTSVFRRSDVSEW